jgi:hypothetical protein
MMNSDQIEYRIALLINEFDWMTSNKPKGRSERKHRFWLAEQNIIYNRIGRLLNALAGQNKLEEKPIDNENNWIMLFWKDNLARLEEHYQEPPFNESISLTDNITLKEFIKKWCVFKRKNIEAEADKIYHILRRLYPPATKLQAMFWKAIEGIGGKLTPMLKDPSKSAELIQKIIDTDYRKRTERIFLSLPYPVRTGNKKRRHVLYRECDLYFAWRHYQRILQNQQLPELKPYGKITWEIEQNGFSSNPTYKIEPIIRIF